MVVATDTEITVQLQQQKRYHTQQVLRTSKSPKLASYSTKLPHDMGTKSFSWNFHVLKLAVVKSQGIARTLGNPTSITITITTAANYTLPAKVVCGVQSASIAVCTSCQQIHLLPLYMTAEIGHPD